MEDWRNVSIFSAEMKQALIVLEDGRTFLGEAVGAYGTTVGEICFNTSMTGYQEVLTDPSYRGQIVAMTYPLIGNYGVNSFDGESVHPHVRGFVVGELSLIASNWRASGITGRLPQKVEHLRDSGSRYAVADEAPKSARSNASVPQQRNQRPARSC